MLHLYIDVIVLEIVCASQVNSFLLYFILFIFPRKKRQIVCVCIWMVNVGYALIKRTYMVKTNNITNKRAYQWNIVLPYLGEDVDREIVKAKKKL